MNPFEIIDVHMHAWWTGGLEALFDPHAPTTVDEQVLKDTLAQMDQLGIRPGVISGPNNVTSEWCRRAPGRFIASWMPDPNPSDSDEEAARFTHAIETQDFRGLGELVMQYAGLAVNDERFFPLYRICQERHLPVFFHTGLNGPDYYRESPSFRVSLCDPLLLEDVAVAFPRLVIVMAHMSFPFTEQATYMLYAHSNVYMDVSTANWILKPAGFHRLLRQVVETVGADKILFGSDQMNMPQMIPVAVSAIREAPFLSEEDKRKILGDNARRLLGIGATRGPQQTGKERSSR
jgi:predicted TIM-barrel fold metal-dependent hydrolase